MRVVIGADEYDPLLEIIRAELAGRGHEVRVVGARPGTPVAWGVVAIDVAERVAAGGADQGQGADQGIVCCQTGTGVCMAANKVEGVRAALCNDAETARGARTWNDANVLALSLRLTTPTLAREILEAWLETAYGGTEAVSLEAIGGLEASGRRSATLARR
jgi:ribose 5-phosphate isomerase B